MRKKLWNLFLIPMIGLLLAACGVIQTPEDIETPAGESVETTATVEEEEYYDTPYEVAEYIDVYGELPENYLTKDEASDLGWDASEGNLWDVAADHSIGGDYFGNFEGLLPEESGRDYYEADIEYEGGYRNAKRLVFSDDGLYFYTDDHYESFEEIQLEEDNQ